MHEFWYFLVKIYACVQNQRVGRSGRWLAAKDTINEYLCVSAIRMVPFLIKGLHLTLVSQRTDHASWSLANPTWLSCFQGTDITT